MTALLASGTTSTAACITTAPTLYPNLPVAEGFAAPPHGVIAQTTSRDNGTNGNANAGGGVVKGTNKNVAKTSYFNNADKIAPYSITTASILAKTTSTCSESKIDEAHNSNQRHGINSDNHDKETEKQRQQQLFEQELSNVIQEILPPSFWEGETSTNDNGKSIGGDANHKSTSSFLERFEIKSLEGGLSNHLFTVTNKYTDETVLVRIYPSEQDQEQEQEADSNNSHNGELNEQHSSTLMPSFIDRENENKIVSYLSKNNIGPKFYGRFRNGRIEEYYKHHKTLQWSEMSISKYARGIAMQLSNLHSVEMEKQVLTNEMRSHGTNDDYNGDGEIWNRIDNWLKTSKKLLSLCTNKNGNNINGNSKDLDECEKETLSGLIRTIEEEWEWYKEEMKEEEARGTTSSPLLPYPLSIEQKAIQFCRQIVFTHMDCQSLNILTPLSTSSSSDTGESAAIIRLIDFEYSSFNRRAVDIANTFLEHCDMNNLKPQYENEYPTDEQQHTFLMSYMRQCWSNNQLNRNDSSNCSNNHVETYLGDLFTCDDANDDEYLCEISEEMETFINVVRNEVTKHTLFSHLEWSCWSIIQSMQSTIDFDYVKYAKLRMEGYFYFKGVAWKNVDLR
mmetsp:Transcript_26760/g.40191  ORF Transcript_26760/g.40191 Transcript_26760/m.40191 type:complete len:620 (-) Transcript_26760:91-1950(-)